MPTPPDSKHAEVEDNINDETKNCQLSNINSLKYMSKLGVHFINPRRGLGMNLFKTSKGLFGFGPKGKYHSPDLSPTVRVGDYLPLLPTIPTAMTLSPAMTVAIF